MANDDKRPATRSKSLRPKDRAPPVAPDIVEQEAGDLIDNIVPSFGYQLMPMVGLGGSAGAIRALQAFFEAMPADSGMVFVVVLHLSPHHASTMAEMIGKWTAMPAMQAVDGEKVKANHVYVIPPGKLITAMNGHLVLSDIDHEPGRRVAIDLFFRSLADTHGPHAAAVVLSGADGDGMLGVRRIKERGGLTIAQDPDEAEHGTMPRTAIDSGMVDWVLKAAEMPRRIVDYVAQESRLELPPEDGPPPTAAARAPASEPEGLFREILVFLRTRTGRDFSYYKRATILRRISRRMQVNGVDNLAGYLACLRTHPGEAGALLKDLLISVTNFFRDRESFEALEARIPALFHGKSQGDIVRVWCPACATGEEAYSVAMLLVEHARTLDSAPGIQVFGCDLDDASVHAARAGLFPDVIAADVSDDRLRRFFVREHRGYRVRRELREIVLFASHDLLKDAPFSRLDLVSCRNLLIYLERDAQARALDIFHFALKPDGLLFLGSAESIDDDSPLFRILDKKHRIYVRKATARAGLPVPAGPSTLVVRQIEGHVAQQQFESTHPHVVVPRGASPRNPARNVHGVDFAAARNDERISSGEMHFKLIERFGPPSVLVDRDYDIQHLSESAGRFLQVVGGRPTTNLLRLVHPSLRLEMRALLFRAASSGAPAEAFLVPAEIDGRQQLVDLRVVPANDLAPDFLVVTFDIRDAEAREARSAGATTPEEPMARHLERELEHVKGHLRNTVEQYEASTEELKASNEELQAMNEELRSATEELETSREELQSINEELTTVNQELKGKVDELGHANSDLQNLMGATAIATLFLDRDMRVMRFTDSAAPIFNLIPGDIGRPVAHLQPRVDYPEMTTDAERVLDTLLPVTREVPGAGGVAYLARMLPYRTQDDRIAGVVVTFIDVTERDRARRELAEDLAATERLRAVAERLTGDDGNQELYDAIVDAAMFIARADGASVQLLDAEARTLMLLAAKGIPTELIERFQNAELGMAASGEAAIRQIKRVHVAFADDKASVSETDRLYRGAGIRSAQSTPLVTRNGTPIGVITTHWRASYTPSDRELRYVDLLARQTADAIERQLGTDAMRRHLDELTRFNEASVGRETRMIELKKEVNALAARLGEAPRYSLEFEKDAE